MNHYWNVRGTVVVCTAGECVKAWAFSTGATVESWRLANPGYPTIKQEIFATVLGVEIPIAKACRKPKRETVA